ncbi:hypothetical protein [Micropruina sonneratiae]|uniref:hypothetical protein n=1 Tax=Micropruina sonneratiae TaxID=2986940 RepID=UPI002226EAC9|nr:hypothetical protein [Micropruina sp. KQZ13P-5]MCW3157407.1 hypothetical protein [Micropruina sp. KQZ13P-5]
MLLYEQLPSTPVIDLNRAVALGMAAGPDAGLAELDRLAAGGAPAGHHLLPAARADLLRRAGRLDDAAHAYRIALALVRTGPEERYLRRRLAALA